MSVSLFDKAGTVVRTLVAQGWIYPTDSSINMAVAQVILQKYDDAHDSLARAIVLGGDAARAEMLQDIRLRPVLAHEKYRDLLAP